MGQIENMRIHFYGVQGSGSVFPSCEERQAFREESEIDLLRQLFARLAGMAHEDGTIHTSVTQILGDEINRKSLRAFRNSFDLPELPVFGGWTTCFRIETADGYDIV
ncbi:MAG: hypothetical protein EX260_12300, partial [Desulfobulbaceae bacterium]